MSVDAPDEIRTKVQRYLSRWFHGQQLGEDENIFERGLVHSLLTMQMILFLEKEFGIEVDLPEVGPNALSSVRRITNLVSERLQRRASNE